MKKNRFRYFKTSPEVIQLTVMMYMRFPLSLRNVEDLLHERGIDICHESVRLWVNRFGTLFAGRIRKKRAESLRQRTQWRWHLDEVFVKINGETRYLWRAVDHEGEVLAAYASKKRNKTAALRFLKKAMKSYGNPQIIVTDKLKSYGAAMREIGNQQGQKTGRHLNNSAENSHFPFRRRERAMQRFRRMHNLQKFASTHASLYNHFNGDRHLNSRPIFKAYRSEALSEWRQLAQMAA
ncbi:MAG: IS6 family transposase [Pseudomonadota bacterium]